MIPKIIHRVWYGDKAPIGHTVDGIDVMTFAPGWDFVMHSFECDPSLPVPIRRAMSNVKRLEILSTIGGLYLDLDAEIASPLKECLFGEDFVWCDELRGEPHYAALGAASHNPHIEAMLDRFNLLLNEEAQDRFYISWLSYVRAHGLSFKTIPPGIVNHAFVSMNPEE